MQANINTNINNEDIINDNTYSESLVTELTLQSNTRKMKNLALTIILLDALLILSLFLSLDSVLPYALFILTEILTCIVITLVCIKFHKVSDQSYKIQRGTIFVYTIIESVTILALCIFALATTSSESSILSVVFACMVPSILVIVFKLWIIFVKKHI